MRVIWSKFSWELVDKIVSTTQIKVWYKNIEKSDRCYQYKLIQINLRLVSSSGTNSLTEWNLLAKKHLIHVFFELKLLVVGMQS